MRVSVQSALRSRALSLGALWLIGASCGGGDSVDGSADAPGDPGGQADAGDVGTGADRGDAGSNDSPGDGPIEAMSDKGGDAPGDSSGEAMSACLPAEPSRTLYEHWCDIKKGVDLCFVDKRVFF